MVGHTAPVEHASATLDRVIAEADRAAWVVSVDESEMIDLGFDDQAWVLLAISAQDAIEKVWASLPVDPFFRRVAKIEHLNARLVTDVPIVITGTD